MISPPFSKIGISAGVAEFSGSCSVEFNSVEYNYSEVFQGISKEGVVETTLSDFLAKNLQFSLLKIEKVYRLSSPTKRCARPAVLFFYAGKRIVISVGEIFYSYTRISDFAPAISDAQEKSGARLNNRLLINYKKTPLPMDFYRRFCGVHPENSCGKAIAEYDR